MSSDGAGVVAGMRDASRSQNAMGVRESTVASASGLPNHVGSCSIQALVVSVMHMQGQVRVYQGPVLCADPRLRGAPP